MPDEPLKETAPEYYGLKCVVTDDMPNAALAMDLRRYMGVDKVAERCGKSVEETYELLGGLEDIGIIESKAEDGKKEFTLLIFVPAFLNLWQPHLSTNPPLRGRYS